MGAGGNYAQAAMQTLFGEQLRQLQNQAAQPAEVNQELVGQYTPESTPVGETTEDITKRFTEGTGAVPQSRDVAAGLASLQEKIGAERDKLPDLTVSTTSTRMVPQYEVQYYSPMQGFAGAPPPRAPTYTTELPKGAVEGVAGYGQKFYYVPGPNPMQSQMTSPRYRRIGDKRITETKVRPAVEGDDVYDKQMNLVNQLQRQYDTRSKYANPSSTGIQGLIAEPIVSQPQTGYNNINEIMKRYIG